MHNEIAVLIGQPILVRYGKALWGSRKGDSKDGPTLPHLEAYSVSEIDKEYQPDERRFDLDHGWHCSRAKKTTCQLPGTAFRELEGIISIARVD